MPLPPLTAIVTFNACAVVIPDADGVMVTVGVVIACVTVTETVVLAAILPVAASEAVTLAE